MGFYGNLGTVTAVLASYSFRGKRESDILVLGFSNDHVRHADPHIGTLFTRL